MAERTKLLIVHHRHEMYRDYLMAHSDDFLIDSIDFREPVPFDRHEAEILFCWKFQEDLLERLPELKWIAATSAGIDHILRALPPEREIPVTRAQGTMGIYMAEYVMQHVLNHLKGFRQVMHQQTWADWRHVKSDIACRYTLGILGIGGMGGAVAKLAKCFNMRVFGAKKRDTPLPADVAAAVDRVFVGEAWREMLPLCDFLVVTLPQTQESENLLGAVEFAAMKQGAVLINIARGIIVREADLYESLRAGHLGGAVLDVFRTEPLPDTSLLWQMPNITITPHCAGPSEEASICDEFLENYRRWRAGEPLLRPVSRSKGY
jgi:phosphoglycerate dehydrogenase-like enzyme